MWHSSCSSIRKHAQRNWKPLICTWIFELRVFTGCLLHGAAPWFHGIFAKSQLMLETNAKDCQGTIDLIFMKLDTDHKADGQQAMDRERIHNLHFSEWRQDRQETMRHQNRSRQAITDAALDWIEGHFKSYKDRIVSSWSSYNVLASLPPCFWVSMCAKRSVTASLDSLVSRLARSWVVGYC